MEDRAAVCDVGDCTAEGGAVCGKREFAFGNDKREELYMEQVIGEFGGALLGLMGGGLCIAMVMALLTYVSSLL